MVEYPKEGEFIDRYIPTISPAMFAFVAASSGFVPPDFTKPFSFIDLGCSRAKTLAVNACLFPYAKFIGVDFNEDSIQFANNRVKKLGLNNVVFVRDAFENLSKYNLGAFDFISAAGLYTWLSKGSKNILRAFIVGSLKDNGLLYLEFASIPGVLENAIFFKFIREIIPSGLEEEKSVDEAINLFNIFLNRPTMFLNEHPKVRIALKRYADGDKEKRKHLLHNVLPKHAFPMYFFDVYDDFYSDGLDFLGRIELSKNDPELSLFPSHVPTIAKFKDDVRAKETVIDFILNIGEHHDIWAKKFERDWDKSIEFIANNFFLLPRQTPNRIARTIKLPGGHKFYLSGKEYDFFLSKDEEPVFLYDHPDFEKNRFNTFRAFYRLAATGELFVCFDKSKLADLDKIEEKLPDKFNMSVENKMLLDDAFDGLHPTYLVSKVLGGVAVFLDAVESVILKTALENGTKNAVYESLLYLHKRKEKVFIDGKQFDTQDLDKEILEKKAYKLFYGRKAFNLQRLSIVSTS